MATIDELEKKYLSGKALCEEIARLQTQKAVTLLSFSGGKDCLAAWLGIREHFDAVLPFYMYMIPGIAFVEETMSYYEKALGTRIVRLPSPSLYRKLVHNVFQSPDRLELIHACQFPQFDYEDIRRVIVEDQNLPESTYYATGVRAPDSPMRMTAISSYGPITHSKFKYHPVWNWRKARLIDELSRAGLKLPVDYRLFSRSWDGIDLRFLWKIKQHFPDDFRRILAWFPLAELEISRYEFHLRKLKVDDLRKGGASDVEIHKQVRLMKRAFTYNEHPEPA